MLVDCVREYVSVLESTIIYAKRSTIIWVEMGLPEWITNQYVAWYVNIEGKLVGSLRGFDGPLGFDDDGLSIGEVVDP